MKFGKEFTAQMVQEWQEAYMDYNLLKSILKDILSSRQKNSLASNSSTTTTTPTTKMNSLRRKVSLYRAFSGLTTRYRSSPKKRDEEAILVSAVRHHGEHEQFQAEQYQTMFLMPADEGGEQELEFFRRLDDQFNKVILFYRKKVDEVVDEADELTRQMNALIALRIKVQNPNTNNNNDSNTNSNHRKQQEGRNKRMDAIQEVEMTSKGHNHESHGATLTEFRPPSLEILNHVRINVAPNTPISTLKGILMSSSSDLSYTKDELKKSEELMVQAFVEFYHKLRLLKKYCFMNQLAFSKIMKKYDKVTQRSASRAYLDMIDKSYLNTCDEVSKLMERVEAAFIKHFSHGNHRNGMSLLRPKQRKEKHTVTFFLGLLVGCSLALVVTVLVLIQSRNIIKTKENSDKFMNTTFLLYSLFGFIVLHMIIFSANIFYWRRFRVNYPFIFGLKEGTDIGYREVFLLSAGLSVLSLAALTLNLDMEIDPKTNFDPLRERIPLILFGVILIIMFCPLNIIYRSSRYFIIVTMFHCLLAPLYKVSLADFFMADQLTSQVQAFRSVLFYIYYYIWGDIKNRSPGDLLSDNVYKALYIVVAIIPYWWRMIQCIRRLIEEKGSMHGFNALKYFLIILAVASRTLFEQKSLLFEQRQKETPDAFLKPPGNLLIFQIIGGATSGIATIYATYWDIVIDWGLLRRKANNRWLRDKLIVPSKTVYFVAIVLNCLLRLAWMQTVLGVREAPFLHQKALIVIVACLEIIRRGLWNFFRIENEHLNNVGKYRAFKSVPLPFNYEDDKQS